MICFDRGRGGGGMCNDRGREEGLSTSSGFVTALKRNGRDSSKDVIFSFHGGMSFFSSFFCKGRTFFHI